jgi:hypothetical protein
MWARSQNRTSDSQSSLQSRPRPHDYIRHSIRAHIPVPAQNVRTHIPVPATAVLAYIPVCAIGVRARPCPPSRCRPLGPRPTSSMRHCVCARLHVCARLRDNVAVHVAANVDKVSQIYHGRSVNARLTLIGWARRSIRRIGRAGGPPHRRPCLEVFNLSLLMGLGDFIFFQFFLLILEDTWTFIYTVGILVLRKSEITKNSSRIASVMEKICTLL